MCLGSTGKSIKITDTLEHIESDTTEKTLRQKLI